MFVSLLSGFMLLAPAGPGAPAAATPCITMNTERLPLATRPSPLDSTVITLHGQEVKVCYGRPSARGRTMLGGEAVPYGKLWRTGANEPTMIHTALPLMIAGVRVGPGSYSLYTVPDKHEWQIIVNRSLTQWGRENYYTPEVAAQEVGRGKVKPEAAPGPVETFTIRLEPAGPNAARMVLEWETTRVVVPVEVAH
ncbi:MAG: DUF2911 domain-containing protein [Gemmatimonadales bacterium]